jgi:uncharacterized protein YbjQ (UPF0145 family)
MKKILLSTTESLYGWEIETYLRPVFANVVVGAGFLSDFNASVTDFFGGRSNSYEKKLQNVNDSALNILMSKATELGANCILGLKVDMDQISGKNVQMFMVTAYGTAVVAKNLTQAKPVSSKEVDKTTISDRAILIKLYNDSQDPNYKLTAEGLQAIIDSKSTVFKDYVFGKLKRHIQVNENEPQVFSDSRKLFAEYFANIDTEVAIKTLYDGLLNEDDEKILVHLAELIFRYDLVDYPKCKELIESESLSKKKAALKILMGDKSFYVQEDIQSLTNLISTIDLSFPIIVATSVKKGFLSANEKEVWTCVCGKTNSIDNRYCVSCVQSRYGFKQDELKPSDVVEFLNNKLSALKEFFNT